jgi:radical SAM superfamily enzyme YgiQ (UPF0313 family)
LKDEVVLNNIKLHFIGDGLSLGPYSLGIGYLSSYLKNKMNNIIITISSQKRKILSDIERLKPDIIGISCTSRYFIEFKQLAQRLKDRFSIPIIWGGVHISLAPLGLPKGSEIAVMGEGEETLLELLLNFHDGRFYNLETIKGIAYWQNGNIKINEKRPPIEPLDKLPFPDWDLLNVKWNKYNRAPILTSRGCPYKCSFCASSQLWGKARLHSTEYVVNCVKELVNRYNIREILIYDDFFGISKKRIAKLAELIKRDSKLNKIRFECLLRADTFNEFIATKLKEMGVFRISFGIESGSQRTLDYLKNKTLKLSQAVRAIKISKSMGFECVASFIIGSPYETVEEIEKTLDFIEKLNLDSVQILIASPFPGTKLWEDGKKINKIYDDEWSDEYYVLYSISRSIINMLPNKKLLTQIDIKEFSKLLERAIILQKKINRNRINKLKRNLKLLKSHSSIPLRRIIVVLKRQILIIKKKLNG